VTSEAPVGIEWPILVAGLQAAGFFGVLTYTRWREAGRRPAFSELTLYLFALATSATLISLGHLFQHYLERAVNSSASSVYESVYGQAIAKTPDYLSILLYTLPYSVVCAATSLSLIHRTTSAPTFLIRAAALFFVSMSALDIITLLTLGGSFVLPIFANAIAALPLAAVATTIYFLAPNFISSIGDKLAQRILGVAGASLAICLVFFLLVHLAIQVFLIPTSANVLATLSLPFSLVYSEAKPSERVDPDKNPQSKAPPEIVSGISQLSATVLASQISATLTKKAHYKISATTFSGCTEKAIMSFARSARNLKFVAADSFRLTSANAPLEVLAASTSETSLTGFQETTGGGTIFAAEHDGSIETQEAILEGRTITISDDRFLLAINRWYDAKKQNRPPTRELIITVNNNRTILRSSPQRSLADKTIECDFDLHDLDLARGGQIDVPVKSGLGVLLLFEGTHRTSTGAEPQESRFRFQRAGSGRPSGKRTFCSCQA
jgi:hypothetical protein